MSTLVYRIIARLHQYKTHISFQGYRAFGDRNLARRDVVSFRLLQQTHCTACESAIMNKHSVPATLKLHSDGEHSGPHYSSYWQHDVGCRGGEKNAVTYKTHLGSGHASKNTASAVCLSFIQPDHATKYVPAYVPPAL